MPAITGIKEYFVNGCGGMERHVRHSECLLLLPFGPCVLDIEDLQ